MYIIATRLIQAFFICSSFKIRIFKLYNIIFPKTYWTNIIITFTLLR